MNTILRVVKYAQGRAYRDRLFYRCAQVKSSAQRRGAISGVSRKTRGNDCLAISGMRNLFCDGIYLGGGAINAILNYCSICNIIPGTRY